LIGKIKTHEDVYSYSDANFSLFLRDFVILHRLIYSLLSKIMMKWKERAKQETIVIEREDGEAHKIFIYLFFLCFFEALSVGIASFNYLFLTLKTNYIFQISKTMCFELY
jgi:predicted transglutaminase-like protease